MSTMLEVKKKHIKQGECSSPYKCAIALALRDHFKTEDVSVAADLEVDGKCYRMTRRMENFIMKFDNGKTVQPTSFRLMKD